MTNIVTLYRCPSDGRLRDWSCCPRATASAQDFLPLGRPGDAAERVRQERDEAYKSVAVAFSRKQPQGDLGE